MPEELDARALGMLKQLIPTSEVDFEAWARIPGRVLILSKHGSLSSKNGQMAFFLAVNILQRLYPIVTEVGILLTNYQKLVSVPLFEGETVREAVDSFLQSLTMEVKTKVLDNLDGSWDAKLSIGPKIVAEGAIVSIASDGWDAYVGYNCDVPTFSSQTNPLGAYAAACLGTLEVYKHILLKKADALVPDRVPSDIRWRLQLLKDILKYSTFDYSVDDLNAPNPQLPSSLDLGELYIIGIGAGGGAAAYALASFESLHGSLVFVDPDYVENHNLKRYIYATSSDAGIKRRKVDVAKELFRMHFKPAISTYPLPYQEFIKQYDIQKMDLVLSTVDTIEAKTDIQWDLPRVMLDAAVLLTEFYVRRVDFGKTPCLLCTHKPSENPRENQLSKIIGLEALEIARLRRTNAPLESHHIETMKPLSQQYGFTLPYNGQRFSDWEVLHCGELQLPLSPQIRFPLPFATILPGILLAGEVVKERHYPSHVLDKPYFTDLACLSNAKGKLEMKSSPDCPLCSKPWTRQRFAQKYNMKM